MTTRHGTISKRILYVSLLVLSYSLAYTQPQLSLTMEKSHLLLREPIWVSVSIQNNDTVAIHYSFFSITDDLKFLLKNEEGKVFKYDGYIVTHGEIPRRTLAPSDSLSKTINLLSAYGIREFNHPMYLFLPTGVYTMQASMTFLEGVNIWSDPVQFTVINPEGTLKAQHDLLVEAHRAFVVERDNDKAVALNDELVARHPQSPYVELAHFESIRILSPSNKVASIPRSKKLIRSFPNSYFVEGEVKYVYSHLIDTGKKRDAEEFIDEIADKLSGTRAGKAAEKLLQAEKQ